MATITKSLRGLNNRQFLITGCFLLFGLILGAITAWWLSSRHYDMPFPLNLPSEFLAIPLHDFWAKYVGDVPWLFKEPQVYVTASVLFWGSLGTLHSVFVKPKIIAWIAGIYLLLFGGLTVALLSA